MSDRLTFEDFPVGREMHFGAYELSAEEIIAFAREFDPQPMHLDPQAALQTRMKGLAAPGMLTCSIAMRLSYDAFISRAEGLGAPGIDETRWLRPVRPGMVLGIEMRVTSARVSRSRPEMGLVGFEFAMRDQTGETVMTQRYTGLYGRRDTTPPPPDDTPAAAPVKVLRPELPVIADPQSNLTRFANRYEDVVIGARTELGTRTFTREDIIRFASKYDPQPFHLSDEGAAASHFGRLSASGWHTAATYMRLFIDTRDRVRAQAGSLRFALNPGRPSPGFTNLRWIRPVHAGDMLAYDTVVFAKEPHARPGLGIIHNRASAANQKGVTVFEIEGPSLAEMD